MSYRLPLPARRTGRALLLGAAIAAPLSGCGGSSSSVSPQDQIRSNFDQIKSAVQNSDAGKFCSLISTSAQQELISQVNKLKPTHDCTSAAKILFTFGGATLKQKLGNAKLKKITVNGDTAVTTDNTGGGPSHWLKQGGTWKLATDSGS